MTTDTSVEVSLRAFTTACLLLVWRRQREISSCLADMAMNQNQAPGRLLLEKRQRRVQVQQNKNNKINR
jgi:predicted ATPase